MSKIIKECLINGDKTVFSNLVKTHRFVDKLNVIFRDGKFGKDFFTTQFNFFIHISKSYPNLIEKLNCHEIIQYNNFIEVAKIYYSFWKSPIHFAENCCFNDVQLFIISTFNEDKDLIRILPRIEIIFRNSQAINFKIFDVLQNLSPRRLITNCSYFYNLQHAQIISGLVNFEDSNIIYNVLELVNKHNQNDFIAIHQLLFSNNMKMEFKSYYNEWFSEPIMDYLIDFYNPDDAQIAELFSKQTTSTQIQYFLIKYPFLKELSIEFTGIMETIDIPSVSKFHTVRIKTTDNYENFPECNIIFENLTEKLLQKFITGSKTKISSYQYVLKPIISLLEKGQSVDGLVNIIARNLDKFNWSDLDNGLRVFDYQPLNTFCQILITKFNFSTNFYGYELNIVLCKALKNVTIIISETTPIEFINYAVTCSNIKFDFSNIKSIFQNIYCLEIFDLIHNIKSLPVKILVFHEDGKIYYKCENYLLDDTIIEYIKSHDVNWNLQFSLCCYRNKSIDDDRKVLENIGNLPVYVQISDNPHLINKYKGTLNLFYEDLMLYKKDYPSKVAEFQ